MYKFTFIPLLFFFCFSPVYSQTISKIQTVQSGNNIIIYYSLSGVKFNQVCNVSVYLSKDGGRTFKGPLSAVYGDVGENITEGNKKIIWEVFKDITNLEGDIVFDVRAEVIEEEIKKRFFINYSFNFSFQSRNYIIAPFGLKIGKLGKTGWYINACLNTKFTDFEYDGKEIINYEVKGYYEFDNEVNYMRLIVTGGLTFQPTRNLFIYTGFGYGEKQLLWHIYQYSYPDDQQTGDAYVKDNNYSISGIETEAGFIIRANKLLFNIGVSALKFKFYSVSLGMGVNF